MKLELYTALVNRWKHPAHNSCGHALKVPTGVNMVDKRTMGFDALGFGADDADWLARAGFETARLGFAPRAVMPEAGVLDEAYIDQYVATLKLLTDRGLFVLIDAHQDGWGGSLYDDGGFPDWMTSIHGAEHTMTPTQRYHWCAR